MIKASPKQHIFNLSPLKLISNSNTPKRNKPKIDFYTHHGSIISIHTHITLTSYPNMRERGDETARPAHESGVAAARGLRSPAGAEGQGCCCGLKAMQMRMGTSWARGRPTMATDIGSCRVDVGGVDIYRSTTGKDQRRCQSVCIMKVCII